MWAHLLSDAYFKKFKVAKTRYSRSNYYNVGIQDRPCKCKHSRNPVAQVDTFLLGQSAVGSAPPAYSAYDAGMPSPNTIRAVSEVHVAAIAPISPGVLGKVWQWVLVPRHA
jgi:hypothetical protein